MEKEYFREEAASSYIRLKEGDETFEISFSKRKDFLAVRLRTYSYRSYENSNALPVLEYTHEFAIKKAKEWNVEAIIFDYYELPKKVSDFKEATSFLDKKYQNLFGQHLFGNSFFGQNDHFHSKSFICFLEKGNLYKTLSFVETVERVIENKASQEPTIEFKRKHIERNYISYNAYYEGKTIFIKLTKRNENTLEIQFDEKYFTFTMKEFNEEEWLNEFHKLFHSDYNKKRLQTVYKPPTRYQDQNITLLADKPKQQEEIMGFLKEIYNMRQLENLFARSVKNKTIGREFDSVGYDDKIALAFIEDCLFIYNDSVLNREKTKYFPLSEKDKAIELYQKMLKEFYEERLKGQIKSTDYRLNLITKRLAKS